MVKTKNNQTSTRISPAVLGGPAKLKGEFILARQEEVESPDWWRSNTNVGLVINCCRRGAAVDYPAAMRQHVRNIDVRGAGDRNRDFESCWQEVEDTLARG